MTEKLKRWSNRVEAARSWDWAVLALFVALVTLVSAHHEPWRDEAQAWLLARDMNLWDLVTQQLRYEGHTPLWYLLLAIPAKLGVPYELGLKTVSLTVAALSAALLIRRSPFPWFARYTLPFTYFLFFQFTVVNRSYCLVVLFMWLAAMCYHSRNRRPWRYAAILAALGGVSAHGMLFGAGFALSWLLEMAAAERKTGNGWIARLLRDGRVHALLAYAAAMLVFVAILWPPADRYTYGVVLNYGGLRPLYALIVAPLDAFVSDVAVSFALGAPWYTGLLPAVTCLLGLAALGVYFHRKKLLVVAVLSYLPFTLFLGFVYLGLYHLGLYAVWLVCLMWVAMSGPAGERRTPDGMPERLRRPWCALGPLAYAAVLVVQLVWTASASIHEIRLPFEAGRAEAQYIKDNGIDGRRIMNQYDFNEAFGQVYTDQVVSVLPYFDRNIFYNFNDGDPDRSYNPFCVPTGREPEQWRAQGPPEFYLENFFHRIEDYPDILNAEDYVVIASFSYHHLWKGIMDSYTDRLYARKDIAGPFLNGQ